ncbi:hypothetical protein JCM10207_002026 [Rhodosporidiobolus poonsookiae]
MASPLSLPAKGTATTASSSLSASSSPSPSSASPPSPPLASTSSSAAPSLPTPPPAPELPALHLAAQRGDLSYLASLPSSSPDPTAADEQGITPLHWAAINGHVLFCKELLRRGAEVDARGGELQGTPLHWAARNGHLPVVHLLLQHSADPTLTDAQSFNSLHLAVHSSSAFLLAYLLFTLQPLAVDTPDAEGHTSLAWAAYQGDAISVELLLLAGASANRPDSAGLRPLHWAVTKGNAACIRRVVEAGAELSAREGQGKTAREMASELKSLAAYERGLGEAGVDPLTGRKVDLPLSEGKANVAIFVVMAAGLGLVFATIGALPWYTALLLAAAEAYGMHHVVARVLLGIKGGGGGGHGHHHGGGGAGGGRNLTQSPYLCAIIAASLGWVGYVWVGRYLSLPGYAPSNLFFALAFLVCCWNFFRTVSLDPGTVERPEGGEAGLKETIEELVETGNFNGMNFCLTCLVRRPLRSKHSYATGRCVARFDHYCPWVWNDVGVNNHRQFLLFVGSLVVGVLFYIHLSWGYFYERAPDLPPDYICPSLLPTPLCMATSYDTFALSVAVWAALQLSWTLVLFAAQLWQVARQMTTLEVSNVSRFGYMGGKPGVSGASQLGYVDKVHGLGGSAEQAARHAANLGGGAGDGAESLLDDPSSLAHAPTPTPQTPGGAPSPARARPRGKLLFLLKLLGLDRFTSSSRHASSLSGLSATARGEVRNPFDLGLRANCIDFWGRGRELGVDYGRLYAVPEGGFGRVVAERRRREREERGRERERAKNGAAGRAGPGMQGGRGGYERLRMEDVV